jgi:hypothetical protein
MGPASDPECLIARRRFDSSSAKQNLKPRTSWVKRRGALTDSSFARLLDLCFDRLAEAHQFRTHLQPAPPADVCIDGKPHPIAFRGERNHSTGIHDDPNDALADPLARHAKPRLAGTREPRQRLAGADSRRPVRQSALHSFGQTKGPNYELAASFLRLTRLGITNQRAFPAGSVDSVLAEPFRSI